MTYADNILKQNITNILENGVWSQNARPRYKDGKVANSKYVTGHFAEYDLATGQFPITTLRPIAWRTAINEMFVFYIDQSNKIKDFEARKVGYWKDWAVSTLDEDGDEHIGKTYSYVIKKHDLLKRIIDGLEVNPWNRRNIINLWDYASFDEDKEALLPCAFNFMVEVREVDGEMFLDGTLIMRSNDMLVAQHLDTMQYVALQMMIAKHFGWKVGKFFFFANNLHIYDNQFEHAAELLRREGQSVEPRLVLNVPDKTPIWEIQPSDFELLDYDPVKPQLRFDLAI